MQVRIQILLQAEVQIHTGNYVVVRRYRGLGAGTGKCTYTGEYCTPAAVGPATGTAREEALVKVQQHAQS